MTYAMETTFHVLIFFLCTGAILTVKGSPGSMDWDDSIETALSFKRSSGETFGMDEPATSELAEAGQRNYYESGRRCFNVGEKYWVNCTFVRCKCNRREEVLYRNCMDANNKCRRVGETGFPCIRCGGRLGRCECKTGGLTVPQKGCGVHQIGEEYWIGCQLYRCVGPQKHELVSRGCWDADSRCRKVGETGYPCILCGKRHEKCECTAGGRSVPKKGCGAHDIGEEYWIGCHLYRCVGPEQQIIVEKGCWDADSKCRKVGETGFPCIRCGKRHESCECKAGGTPVPSPKKGCGDHKIGEEYWIGCKLYRCVGPEQELLVSRGCLSANLKCMKVGEDYWVGCQHLRCVGPQKEIVIGNGCWDANSKCRNVNETGFPCIHEAKIHEECICKPDGVAVPKEEKCGEHKVGEDFFINCQLYRCVGSQKQEFIANACQDESRTCRLVGDHGFACTVGGVQYKNCRCEEDLSSENGVIIVPIKEGS